MNLTIIETGEIPEPLRHRFVPYADMFGQMFARAGRPVATQTIAVHRGDPLPEPQTLDAVLITGSPAGVYDPLPWLDPLRDFIRAAYAADLPMLGICFGHQIIADALGGEVRKSEKGWGMGRHAYRVVGAPGFLPGVGESVSILCSHQDQVIVPPAEAEVFLASPFTPNDGLAYRNGRVVTLQPHPEFADDYAIALADLRRGRAPDAVVDAALASFTTPSDSPAMGRWLADWLIAAAAQKSPQASRP
ncbi:GMP synthase-Glutamine amidotransferase [Devosia enhydra]|uniref:GMP synthase-Glutamine amidotransferase n=1 Tax=Devosia enhydra TaxID=665118 RepID=A0A1K2I3T7_9HYPH|nr:type 1 glutamine amidotransferase [Devosia enhydra]SFZ86412.1 GMP synthase-Glutamine amidotransferase [Devosia enhydra]